MAGSGNKQPVKNFRFGNVKCAVWCNESEGKKFYNVTFSRSYKVGEDWNDADSFGRDDLLLVAKLANQAHSFIFAELQRGPLASHE